MGTRISKILAFIRELVVAYQFGAGAVSDAFILTNSIPTLLFVSLATVVGITYIPVCSGIEDEESINKFTSNLMNILLIVMMVGCIFEECFPHVVLSFFALGLPALTKQYALLMLRIVIFSIVPIIWMHLLQAYLQVKSVFYATALSGICLNVMSIVMTLLSSDEKFYLLSIGTVMANVAALVIIFPRQTSSGRSAPFWGSQQLYRTFPP